MTSFEDAMRAQLEADPKIRRKGARILGILNRRASKRRTRQIAAMEAHAAAQLRLDHAIPFPIGVAIDWSKVEWTKYLAIIVQVLLALLVLL